MSGRNWRWRWLAYVTLFAVVVLFTAHDLRDGSEIVATVVFAVVSLVGEVFAERRGRVRRAAATMTRRQRALDESLDAFTGYGSDSTWGCKGKPADKHTNFTGSSLSEHLDAHARRVLAHAQALGCQNSTQGDGGDCPGPWSETTWNCNGTPETVETCSPAGTSLDDHLATHKERVLARADELGCAS